MPGFGMAAATGTASCVPAELLLLEAPALPYRHHHSMFTDTEIGGSSSG